MYFQINPYDRGPGRSKEYRIDTLDGTQVAATTVEQDARALRDALNQCVEAWVTSPLACDFTVIGYRPGAGYFCEVVSAASAALAGHKATFGHKGYSLPDVVILAVLEGRQTSLFGVA